MTTRRNSGGKPAQQEQTNQCNPLTGLLLGVWESKHHEVVMWTQTHLCDVRFIQ